ncbi:MAG: NAD-dependent epimerase/dehydratase family protein [bacterium]
MKVAVTGISGYLGGLIARGLRADPAVEFVLGLDVVEPEIAFDKFAFRRADVCSADFKRLLTGYDVVYHLASIVEPPKKLSMKMIDEINVGGSRRVFEGAAEAGVAKIIYASSIAVYGAHSDNPPVITEDTPLRPNGDWYYSRTKAKAEFYLDDLQRRRREIVVIRFRPSIFLGPGVNNSIGEQFASRFLLSFSKNVKMDFCWDEDIADAFLLGLKHGESDIFNLSGDGALSVEDMGRLGGGKALYINHDLAVAAFQIASAVGLFPAGTVDWIKVGAAETIHVSSEKAKTKLGWKPRYDAAAAYVRYIKSRADGLRRY